MSRLNASRIVNLCYNKNTMRINNETFEFGGESTLISLRNGGGKTVMVQMLLAPFVKRRDLKDRKFFEYFNTSSPTYILTEWLLDNNSGYVLIGMGVRKKQVLSEDDTKNELDMVTFIHEYKYSNDYDIHNIPIIEDSKNGLKIKPLSEVRKMFEELKNSRRITFDYFELSQDHQRKRYFERLKEFNINQKEWETIIQKINMKESGLSELFVKSKTIPSLVNEWFLPAIEDKLDDNGSKMANFRNILSKYIFQLKENESKILRKKGIEEFQYFSANIINAAAQLQAVQKDMSRVENDIANLLKYIKKHISELDEEKTQLESLRAKINEELGEIEFEKLSFEYYKIVEEQEKHEAEAREIQGKIDIIESDKTRLTKELGFNECAKLYRDYLEKEKSVLDIEYKLKNAELSDKALSEHLKDVGYTLNVKYSEKIRDEKALLEAKSIEGEEKEKEKSKLERDSEEKNKKIKALIGDIAVYKEKNASFERYDKGFRQEYTDFIANINIFGEYEDTFLRGYQSKLVKREEILKTSLADIKSRKESSQNKFEKNNEEINQLKQDKIQSKNDQKGKKNDLAKLEEKCEHIKRIMRYCNLDENMLFEKEHIISALTSKLKILNQERDDLHREIDKNKHLKEMYESGKNIKLPEEFTKKLDDFDIPVLYGLMWLQKQPLTIEKKLTLIKKNPFLPFSIIMNSSRIELLKKESLDIFTSIPIPIIEQDKLELGMEVVAANKLYSLQNINFYISFNENLLNEAALKNIIDDIKRKIEYYENQIKIKDEEIKKFSIDLEDVNRFDIKKLDIDKLKQEIGTLDSEILLFEQRESSIAAEIESLKIILKELEKGLEEAKEAVAQIEKAKKSYANLLSLYEEYKGNRKMERILSEQRINDEKVRDELIAKIRLTGNEITVIKEELSGIKHIYGENIKKYQEYLTYSEGILLKKDLVDLEADFAAMKSKMGLAVQEYSGFLNNERRNFREIEIKLTKTQSKYSISEDDYKYIFFDEIKVEFLQRSINDCEKGIKEASNKKRIEDDKLIEINSDKRHKLNRIKEVANRELPKERVEITNVDFLGRKEQANVELRECMKSMSITASNLELLRRNLDFLEEYKDFAVIEEQELEIEYSQLGRTREGLIKQYKLFKVDEGNKRTVLTDSCGYLSSDFKYRLEEYFKNTIDILLEIKNKPDEILQTLAAIEDVHTRTMLQLQADLAKIDEEKNAIIAALLDYVEEIYKHMNTIDDNSSLNIGGRSYKMLNIEQPEWQQEMNTLKMKDYMDMVVEECKSYLSLGKSIDDLLGKEITSSKLYDQIVGINGLEIKLYKIETSKVVRISWNEVAQNSCGEGFVSAFIIMVCLLSYMRREEDTLINTKEEGKVLIMDNPFAQTNAEHLLKPLIDIAEKYNTQLICFTGLGGDSIYNRFSNIYVLNLLDSKLHPGLQVLESEHKKGEELTQMTSTRFLIKNEKLEQVTLF